MNSSHDVLLNDGQAKRKVSKLVGSWAIADNQAKLIRQTPRPNAGVTALRKFDLRSRVVQSVVVFNSFG